MKPLHWTKPSSMLIHSHKNYNEKLSNTHSVYNSMTMTIMARVVDKISTIKPKTETMQTIVIRGKVSTWKFSLYVVCAFCCCCCFLLLFFLLCVCVHTFSHSVSVLFSHWCQISRTLAQRAFHKTPFRKSVFLCDSHFPIHRNGNGKVYSGQRKKKHTTPNTILAIFEQKLNGMILLIKTSVICRDFGIWFLSLQMSSTVHFKSIRIAFFPLLSLGFFSILLYNTFKC